MKRASALSTRSFIPHVAAHGRYHRPIDLALSTCSYGVCPSRVNELRASAKRGHGGQMPAGLKWSEAQDESQPNAGCLR